MSLIFLFFAFYLSSTKGNLFSRNKDAAQDNQDGGIKAYVNANRFFMFKRNLPPPEKELQYSFIVLKHAMVAPEVTSEKTYPSDPLYESQWKPGEETQRGRSLMLMVGKSLRTRYKAFLNKIDRRNHITVSSIDKLYARKLTSQLGYGLFNKTPFFRQFTKSVPKWVTTQQNYDLIEQISPVIGDCTWLKILYWKFEEAVALAAWPLNRCADNLFETLRKMLKVEDPEHEWFIDSPSKVYKLWTLLIFEIMQGQKEPKWVKEKWPRMQTCVFEYYRNLLKYHPAVLTITSGRMIQQMEDELNNNHAFHVHVTNDLGVLSLNWTLPNTKLDYWPEFGDAILFDFFKDDTVEVSSFSGWQRTFKKIYEAPTQTFFDEYKGRNIKVTQDEWNKLCSYNGMVDPPDNIHSSLVAYPQTYKSWDQTITDTDSDSD